MVLIPVQVHGEDLNRRREIAMYRPRRLAAALLVLPSPFQMKMEWTLESFVKSILFIPHLSPSGVGVFPVLSVGWTLNFEVFFYLFLGMMILGSWGIGQVAEATKSILACACFQCLREAVPPGFFSAAS